MAKNGLEDFAAQLRREVEAFKRAHRSRHSASFKSAYYVDSKERYDWRASEARRAQLKKEFGL